MFVCVADPDYSDYVLQVIICLHGVGAPPSDFIPLCDSMRSLPINILWVFPAAPKKVIPGPLNPPTWFKALQP